MRAEQWELCERLPCVGMHVHDVGRDDQECENRIADAALEAQWPRSVCQPIGGQSIHELVSIGGDVHI